MTEAMIGRSDLAWLLERAVAREEARLGAEAQDRLLVLPVRDIIERASILSLNPTIEQIRQGVPEKADLPASSVELLSAIQASPTPSELADLAFIDAFFSSGPLSTSSMNPRGIPSSRLQELLCATGKGATPWNAWIVLNPSAPRAIQETRRVTLPDPFFCPAKPEIYRNVTVDYYYGGNAPYFGIDTGRRWSEVRPVLLNIENLFKMIGDPARRAGPSYPWPGPAIITHRWWDLAQSGLWELVRQPGILTEDSARLWVTLSVLTEYNKLADYAKDYLEEEAKKQRFNLIVKTVAFIAIGAIMGYAIAAAMVAAGASATAGTTASTVTKMAAGAVTESEKKEAAAGLNDAAKQLQTVDPGFAGQVQWSAEYIRQLLSEASRPEVQGGSALEAAVGIGVPTLLSIGLALLKR